MSLFERHFDDTFSCLQKIREDGKITELSHRKRTDWPTAGGRDIVLGMDTAVELGHPKEGSTACLIWTNGTARLKNKRISLIGPDLPALDGKRISFGKIALIGGKDFNNDNCYERYRKLENVRFDIRLKGYMMRGVSQYGREWSRVSREAIDNGFSFSILGSALIDKYLDLDFVQSVEIVFFTSGMENMKPFIPIAQNALKIIGAMNKMTEDISYDCDSCEYNDVCSTVEGLRAMHQSLQQKKKLTNEQANK